MNGIIRSTVNGTVTNILDPEVPPFESFKRLGKYFNRDLGLVQDELLDDMEAMEFADMTTFIVNFC